MLGVERLCDRVVLDGAGLGVSDPLPWFDPGALTYSFAPDGTNVAGQESRLFSQLDQVGQTSAWQSQFDAAFHAWLSPLNATIEQVADSGSRFGIAGRTQGDFRFGDIRIAAVSLSSNVLATSVPHSAMVQGTWAGDILVNADAEWNDLQEVFAVALHEFGHVLGLPHSDDPLSPMYVHGLHDALAPTPADVERLLDVYVGIDFEDESGDSDHRERTAAESEADPKETGERDEDGTQAGNIVEFDLANAVPLAPAIGSTVRYTANAIVTDFTQPIVYRLDPTVAEAEDLENLHIALQSTGTNRLLADVMVVDAQGRSVESTELHHGQGSVIVQALGVDSERTHYVVVTPSSAAVDTVIGEFEIVADYGPELRLSREIGQITLDAEHLALEQSFSVSSSRLVHLHLEIPNLDQTGLGATEPSVRALLLDSSGDILTYVALQPGTSRSAPLTFLAAGDYTLRFVAGLRDSAASEIRVNVFLDEVSIDVGPGVSDPTGTPFLPCEEPGGDPQLCDAYSPIALAPPTTPDPIPEPVAPDYPWWWDYGFTCGDYAGEDLQLVQLDDPLWWEFYVDACQPATTPTNPPVTNPPVTNPTSHKSTSHKSASHNTNDATA